MSFAKVSCIVLGVCFFANSAYAEAPRVDVAIDALSGDNLILHRMDNPKGQLLILNDRDESVSDSIELLDVSAPRAQFEIELSRADMLSYLVQNDGIWQVKGLSKVQGRWEKLSLFSGVSGRGEAKNLTALPDGRLALTVTPTDGSSSQVVVIEPPRAGAQSAGDSSYQVVDTVIAEAVQVVSGSNSSSNSLGFTVGGTSAIGVAYRKHFENLWGIQIGGVAFGSQSSLFGSLGAVLMRTLSRTQWTRFYALMGVSAFYSGQNSQVYPDSCGATDKSVPCDPTTEWTSSTLLNFGAGIGMEFTLAENLGLAVELPLTVMLDVKRAGVGFVGVYPIPNASLVYYF